MSTTTISRHTDHTEPQAPNNSLGVRTTPAQLDTSRIKVTPWRVVASEWVKFTSLRSTTWLLAATAVLIVGFGALAAAAANTLAAEGRAPTGGPPAMIMSMTPAELSMAGVQFALLMVGVLGVMFATGEYSSGMIRTSLNAVPNRLPILFGKAVVLATSVFATMLAACFVAFFVAQQFVDANAALITDAGVVEMILGNACYLAGAALIGLAFGLLLRSTSGAIAAFVGAFMLLPMLVGLILPDDWASNITPYLPSEAGSVFSSMTENPDMLSAGPAIAVFVAWVVALLIGSAIQLKQRDA